MNHIGRSFVIAFALIIGMVALAQTPVGHIIQASLVSVSANLLTVGR